MIKRLLLSLLLISSVASAFPKVGETVPDWKKGILDLHFINSGTGECLFCVFPDGTSMVIDGGETATDPTPRPASPAWKVYADYISHFLAATGSREIDYVLLSHFHTDHFGNARCSQSDENGYAHMGLTGLYDRIKYRKIVDRGYPSYGADSTIFFNTEPRKGNTSRCVTDWIGFVKYAVSQGSAAERFELGSDSQFGMKNRGKYDFKITNIVANGSCIYRRDDGSVATASAKVTSENAASCGIHLKYGNFDFISCGDLSGPPQNLFAKYCLTSFGSSVELFKANHHLHHNAWGSGMTEVGFKPQAVIAFSWCKTDTKHFPAAMVEKVSALTDLYATSPKSAGDYPETYSKLKDYGGHFLVRVFRNGTFYILKLSDNETDFKVQAVHGPYRSSAR